MHGDIEFEFPSVKKLGNAQGPDACASSDGIGITSSGRCSRNATCGVSSACVIAEGKIRSLPEVGPDEI